jgi:hypothetical protein
MYLALENIFFGISKLNISIMNLLQYHPYFITLENLYPNPRVRLFFLIVKFTLWFKFSIESDILKTRVPVLPTKTSCDVFDFSNLFQNFFCVYFQESWVMNKHCLFFLKINVSYVIHKLNIIFFTNIDHFFYYFRVFKWFVTSFN